MGYIFLPPESHAAVAAAAGDNGNVDLIDEELSGDFLFGTHVSVHKKGMAPEGPSLEIS